MKKISRLIGTIAAVVTAVVSIPTEAVTAENPAADSYEMSILIPDTRKDTISISSLDTAEKDVTITVGLYITSDQWSEDDCVESVSANWGASDSEWISFSNITDLTQSGEEKTISYSGGSYLSRYTPYCFVDVVESRKYGQLELSRPISETTTEDAYDPVFGSEIYQAGENQIRFSYYYYASAADVEADVAERSKGRMKFQEQLCDVQYTSDGTAYYEFSYVRPDNFETATAIGYLPVYDPSAAVGEKVYGMADFVFWVFTGEGKTSFFGESSDEFPLVTFDITLKKGTPSGMYTVDFLMDNGRTFLSGIQTKTHFPSSANGFTIMVDENAPRMTEPAVTTTQSPTTSTETSVTTAKSAVSSIAAEHSDPTVTENTQATMTLPTLKPSFLDSQKTIYVDELTQLNLFNATTNQIAWLSSNPDIVSIVDSVDNMMWMNGNKPGTATIYAVVDGKAISCEITVVEKDVLTLYGDVTQDQMIEITDLVCLSKYIMGSINLDYYARKNADCNADGKINNIDAIVLQQFLVQRIKELPFSPVTE